MEFSFALTIKATAQRLWDFYADTRNWFVWEEDLEDIRFEHGFVTGATGRMRLRGMPELTFELTSVVPLREFWDKTETPLGTLLFGHELLETADGIRVRHTVRLESANSGPEQLAFLRRVFADVPASLLLLKKAAEQ